MIHVVWKEMEVVDFIHWVDWIKAGNRLDCITSICNSWYKYLVLVLSN